MRGRSDPIAPPAPCEWSPSSLTVLLTGQLTLGLYYGHAFGQGVVRATFAGANADYGFTELTYRY